MWKHIVRSRTFDTDDVVKCYPDVIISFEKSNSVGIRQNDSLGAGCMPGPSVFFSWFRYDNDFGVFNKTKA